MQQQWFLFILIMASMLSSAQEKKKDTTKVKQLDSIQVKLEQAIEAELQNTPKDLNIIVLKGILKKLSPKKKKKPEQIGWKSQGKFSFLFNQSAFNYNWQGGGTSNIASNAILNYNVNYKKDGFTWDNKLLGDYGITILKGEDFPRKTNDRIEFNTRLGKRIHQSFWNYSFFLNFRSQFAKGYKFSEDPDTGETLRTEETEFFSPSYIQAGPGILWKKSDDFNFNIAPVTSRMIFVDDRFTTTPGYVDGDYFGIDQGETARFEFGGSLAGYFKFEVIKNIEMENILNLYSNYIEDPWNVDIDYTLNLNLVVNKYVSGSFAFQAIYDDNATSGFQIREVLGLGLNYEF
ncbi:DUF3078 domain-containing protein [Aquimarina brevivitae]|uniref:DUF3078 family protein n=1 Tax=Aquimarina brevivitae TaxID=323412 RepID=A0A4Q7PFU4_9FLAO|nr:DUF3078 domain-containing protein [Aquimarina brevivitae]RZS99356.1 DUF3078 family protein [Aquimarina brevivitae]